MVPPCRLCIEGGCTGGACAGGGYRAGLPSPLLDARPFERTEPRAGAAAAWDRLPFCAFAVCLLCCLFAVDGPLPARDKEEEDLTTLRWLAAFFVPACCPRRGDLPGDALALLPRDTLDLALDSALDFEPAFAAGDFEA